MARECYVRYVDDEGFDNGTAKDSDRFDLEYNIVTLDRNLAEARSFIKVLAEIKIGGGSDRIIKKIRKEAQALVADWET